MKVIPFRSPRRDPLRSPLSPLERAALPASQPAALPSPRIYASARPTKFKYLLALKTKVQLHITTIYIIIIYMLLRRHKQHPTGTTGNNNNNRVIQLGIINFRAQILQSQLAFVKVLASTVRRTDRDQRHLIRTHSREHTHTPQYACTCSSTAAKRFQVNMRG